MSQYWIFDEDIFVILKRVLATLLFLSKILKIHRLSLEDWKNLSFTTVYAYVYLPFLMLSIFLLFRVIRIEYHVELIVSRKLNTWDKRIGDRVKEEIEFLVNRTTFDINFMYLLDN